jgi:hypothetical protein
MFDLLFLAGAFATGCALALYEYKKDLDGHS